MIGWDDGGFYIDGMLPAFEWFCLSSLCLGSSKELPLVVSCQKDLIRNWRDGVSLRIKLAKTN